MEGERGHGPNESVWEAWLLYRWTPHSLLKSQVCVTSWTGRHSIVHLVVHKIQTGRLTLRLELSSFVNIGSFIFWNWWWRFRWRPKLFAHQRIGRRSWPDVLRTSASYHPNTAGCSLKTRPRRRKGSPGSPSRCTSTRHRPRHQSGPNRRSTHGKPARTDENTVRDTMATRPGYATTRSQVGREEKAEGEKTHLFPRVLTMCGLRIPRRSKRANSTLSWSLDNYRNGNHAYPGRGKKCGSCGRLSTVP